MRHPRACVTRHQRQWKQPPFADCHDDDYKGNRAKSADTVHEPRRGLAVFAEVVRPKIGKRFEFAFGHYISCQPMPFRSNVRVSADEVSTGSGSDRVTALAISILAELCDPVATAPGTDSIT